MTFNLSLTLTMKQSVFNLCSAHCLNEVDMTIGCEIFSEMDYSLKGDMERTRSVHVTFDLML